MSSDKNREQAARGEEAARILHSPLLKEFFSDLRSDCVRNWENSAIDDVPTREDAWKMHKAIGLLEQKLKAAIATGDYARKELLKEEKEK